MHVLWHVLEASICGAPHCELPGSPDHPLMVVHISHYFCTGITGFIPLQWPSNLLHGCTVLGKHIRFAAHAPIEEIQTMWDRVGQDGTE